MGPNGAGKSTLLNILGSRRMVTKGDVRLAGHRAFHDHAALDRVVSLLSSEWKRQVSELTSGRALTFQEISATWMKESMKCARPVGSELCRQSTAAMAWASQL